LIVCKLRSVVPGDRTATRAASVKFAICNSESNYYDNKPPEGARPVEEAIFGTACGFPRFGATKSMIELSLIKIFDISPTCESANTAPVPRQRHMREGHLRHPHA
jgi:hypothetical protein